MRTTVTLDPDVERLLKDAMHRTRRSFKETLNDAVRTGLRVSEPQRERKPFKVEARPMGLRPGIDPAGFNKLVDELEVEDFIAELKRTEST
ncbi:MAG: antitoxin [Candidatus Hydrogenedentes bacterium]|nr:antitoxin [Candidatus Hydrogenedentota bacterium]